MPRFAYRAVKFDGEVEEGEMEAADEAALVRQLQAGGLIPLKTRPAGRLLDRLGKSAGKRISQKDIGLLTRQLATLMEAGLTLDRSLQILSDLADDEQVAGILADLQEAVRGGSTFSKALEGQGGLFPSLYINMVRAGEASGALEAVLGRLADYLERSAELRDTIKSALVYPAILFFVAGLSVIMLLVFVVPQFAQLFADMGEALPVPTRIVLGAGDLFREYWWLMLVLAALIAVLVQKLLEQPKVRERWDIRVLGMPLFGDLIWKLETARFCHTLATLLQNGLPLLNAMGLAKEVVANSQIAGKLGEAAEELKHGKGLAGPLYQRETLPRLALQMIKVGEESGSLDAMLAKVADVYDGETRSSVQRMLTLLEPLLIIGLGIIVAGIIMSILVAILGANELVF